MCLPILIEALSTLIISIIGTIIIVTQRNKTSKFEIVIGSVIIILCFCFAINEFYHSANPSIENITAELDYYNRPKYKIGHECSFTDSNGEKYTLYIDPLTFRKYVNNDLIQNQIYEISYDINEKIIIDIKEQS